MKKLLVVFALSIMMVQSVFGQSALYNGKGGEGKVVLLDEPVMVNGLKNGSDKWLTQSVKTDVLSDLSQYSAMKLLESEQQKNVLKLQKESESAMYDDNDMLELRRMVKAREYIKLTITRIEQKGQNLYGLQATIVNIETGTSEGGYNPKSYYSQTDFLTKAHGELSAGVLEQLGVELTETGKRLIAKANEVKATGGSSVKTQNIAVVSAKELKDAQDNLNAIDTELLRMQEKLADIENSSAFDLEKEAEKMRLENQKATLLQQQKSEQEHIARMKAESERRAREAEESKKRSAEQQQKIDEIASEIEAKSAELFAKANRNGVEEQVVTLEKQKAVYVSNQRRINDSIKAAEAGIEAERRNAIRERKAEPPRKADLNADGTRSENGRKALESALAEINEKYETRKSDSAKEITSSFSDMQDPLWTRIESDKEEIAKGSYIASTLDNKVILNFKDYDGTAQGWAYDIKMTFNAVTVFSSSGTLTYKDITGKEAPQFPDRDDKKYDEKVKAYNTFQDDIELFDSFFRTGVPFVTANIAYTIAAAPYNRPSEYDIKLDTLSFFNLQQNKETSKMKLKESKVYRYYPVTFIDWRTDKERNSDEKASAKVKKSLLSKAKFQNSMGRAFSEDGWVSTVIAVVAVIVGVIVFFCGGRWLGCLGTLIVFGLIIGGVQSCGKKLRQKAWENDNQLIKKEMLDRFQWKTYELFDDKDGCTISFLDNSKVQLTIKKNIYEGNYSVDSGTIYLSAGDSDPHAALRVINNLLVTGQGQYYDEIFFDNEDIIAKGNEEYLAGMTFKGKWNNQEDEHSCYDAEITFGKDGKAKIAFSDGDNGEGAYMLNRSGTVALYNHRNKGKWVLFEIEQNGGEITSITLRAPNAYYGRNWTRK